MRSVWRSGVLIAAAAAGCRGGRGLQPGAVEPPALAGDSATAPAGGDPVDRCRRLLQSLRAEVVGYKRKLDAGTVADGMPLLRRGGRLFHRQIEETLPEDAEWVLDPWARPIVILEADADPDDWCLASPGPDRVWTTDGVAGIRGALPDDTSPTACAERAPHYHGAEEPLHRTVLGDDIVLHGPTGLFFRAYTRPLPEAAEAVRSLSASLRNGGAGAVMASRGLVEEIESLSSEERDLAAAFVDSHAAGFELCEDTWSHECRRKHGLLPRLYLRTHALRKEVAPFLWIEPQQGGWTLDWEVEDLFRALEEAPP